MEVYGLIDSLVRKLSVLHALMLFPLDVGSIHRINSAVCAEHSTKLDRHRRCGELKFMCP